MSLLQEIVLDSILSAPASIFACRFFACEKEKNGMHMQLTRAMKKFLMVVVGFVRNKYTEYTASFFCCPNDFDNVFNKP